MGAIGGCEFQGAETDNLMQVQWILVDISIYNGVCVCVNSMGSEILGTVDDLSRRLISVLQRSLIFRVSPVYLYTFGTY